MKKEILTSGNDPFLTLIKDIKPRPGFSPLDEYRMSPRKSISRSYELVSFSEQIRWKSQEGVILCPGSAVGIDSDSCVCHFWPNLGLEFIGFLIASGDNREVAVKSRGSVILNLQEAQPGNSVFCCGPDTFSLTKSPGSAEIGKVRFCQGNRAAVAFRRTGDERPLNLEISRF